MQALPARARVSEPALPLLLAALHEQLGRALLVLLPEDADARDAAEGASWYLGTEGVACSRAAASGTTPGSSRRRTSSASAPARSRCSSTAASSAPPRSRSRKALPPLEERPQPTRLAVGEEPGLDGLAEALALAGYARVERAEERGQFAVRGGILDIFPSTGREPIRVEFFGDEIEAVRAFSPFTQRALHPVEEATVFPATERRADRVERRSSPGDEDEQPLRPHARSRAAGRPRARLRLAAGRRPARARGGGAARARPDAAPPSSTRSRAARRSASRRSARRSPPAASPRRRTSSPASSAAATASSSRSRTAARRSGRRRSCARCDAELLEPDERLPADAAVHFAVSPARRGFVWRELGLVLLPDTQVFRKRPPRADGRLGRALQSFADLRTGDYVVHEDHGVGKLLGFETKEVAGRHARLPARRLPGRRPPLPARTSSSASSRSTSAPTRRRRSSRSSAARPGRTSRRARGSRCASWPASCSRSTPAGSARRASPSSSTTSSRAARGVVPVPRDRGPGARDRGRRGGPGGAAPDGPARLRGRRLRQDGGRRPRRIRCRRQRQADAGALPDDDPRRAALETFGKSLSRLTGNGRDGLSLPDAETRSRRSSGTFPKEESTSLSGRTGSSRAT